MESNNSNKLKFKVRTKDSKTASFKRLAEKRTINTLKCLDLIANLSNKYYYEYEDGDVDKIFTALKERLKEAEKQFLKERSSKKKEEFKL